MRRVARDGSSHYFINQSTCRLTDVVELLAQVGLGKELHSIIGQGKVESFLAGKPEDRRSQIEEAAGLGAYKRRRERAELKLREVRRNLERALLLEREVGSQLAPLRRQATAAEQMRTVQSEIAETRGRLLTGDVLALDAELEARRAELAAVDGGPGHARGRPRPGRERPRPRGRDIRPEARRARAQRPAPAARPRARRAPRERAQARRAATAPARRGRARGCGRARAPGRRARRPARGARRRHVAAGGAAPRRRVWRPPRPSTRASPAELETARQTTAERRAALDRLAVERETALATAARLERRREALGGEQERLTAQHEAMTAEVAGKAEEEREAAAAEAAAREALRAAEAAASAAATAVVDAARAVTEAEDAHRSSLMERRALEAEADHLRAALLDMEDVGGEVMEVAGEFPGTVSLAGSVSCEAGYERALAAALAQLSGALAVPRGVDQWSLLDALKRAGDRTGPSRRPGARPSRRSAFPARRRSPTR